MPACGASMTVQIKKPPEIELTYVLLGKCCILLAGKIKWARVMARLSAYRRADGTTFEYKQHFADDPLEVD
jgi:hypothetical protein